MDAMELKNTRYKQLCRALTLASVGGGSSSPPQYVSVRHFYAVWDNKLSFSDF